MIAARTLHGRSSALARARQRYAGTLATRIRLYCAAVRLRAYLPPEMAARLDQMPAELMPQDRPFQVAFPRNRDTTLCNSLPPGCATMGMEGREGARRGLGFGPGGSAARPVLRGRHAERLVAQAEASSQAPWRQAIAAARAAKRADKAASWAERTARRAERVAELGRAGGGEGRADGRAGRAGG